MSGVQSQEKVWTTGEPLAEHTSVMNIDHISFLAASRVLAISLFSVLEARAKLTEHQCIKLANAVAEAVPGLDCWGGIAEWKQKEQIIKGMQSMHT